MDTLKAKGSIYNELKSKITATAYRKNSTLRSKNTRRINSEIERINKILETPSKQEKAYKQKIKDLKTLKALIEEESSKENNNTTLQSVKEPEPKPKPTQPKPKPTEPIRFSYPSRKDDNPPTVVFGHSLDRCDADGKLIELVVPENCMYITFTECGLQNYINESLRKKFFDPKNRKYLLDPVKYEKELNLLFNNNIHIHRAGSTYIDTIYYPTGYYDNYPFGMSGVVPIEEDTELIPEQYYAPKDYPNDISHFFKYSIYPTEEDTKDKYSEIVSHRKDTGENILKIFYQSMPIINQSLLFKQRPGIYYNPLCRNTSKKCYAAMRERRRHSLANAKRVISEIDLEDHFKFIKKITNNCVNDDSCEELQEFAEQIPQLSYLGLNNASNSIQLFRNKKNPLITEILEKINLAIDKLRPIYDPIQNYIIGLFVQADKNKYIKNIVEYIGTKSGEEKANLIRLTNIDIDRGIFILEKLRDSLKMSEGGKRKTLKK